MSEEIQKAGRISARISQDVIEKARDAVYWTPGLTLAGMIEDALQAAVERLEAERGTPFPPRKGEITTGRPVSR